MERRRARTRRCTGDQLLQVSTHQSDAVDRLHPRQRPSLRSPRRCIRHVLAAEHQQIRHGRVRIAALAVQHVALLDQLTPDTRQRTMIARSSEGNMASSDAVSSAIGSPRRGEVGVGVAGPSTASTGCSGAGEGVTGVAGGGCAAAVDASAGVVADGRATGVGEVRAGGAGAAMSSRSASSSESRGAWSALVE